MNDVVNIVYIVLIVLSILCSAFFSGSEIAFASANKFRLKKAAESGSRRARTADYVAEHFSLSLSTILVGNNLVNIIATSAATLLTLHWLLPSRDIWVTAVMTLLILIFGEIIPKTLSNEYADGFALFFARPLRFCMILFYPVVRVVTWMIDGLSHIWKPKEEPNMTQDELYTALEEIEEEGVFTESESELIKSAIEFTDITAHEILIPRVDVVAFDIEDGLDALLESEDLLHFTRFPVYRETIDNIIGILSVKRLMKELVEKGRENIDLESLLYEPVFVHKTMAISAIIKKFRRAHAQMAVVVDEYGGTMGILTMEDIVEEIVGEIYDESDRSTEEEAVKRAADIFEVDGSMNVYDMFELVGFDPGDDFESEYNTAGGWATERLDRFPEPGDTFTYENLQVEVLEAQSFRVDKLLVTVIPAPEDED
ncbi:MAG: HlyC/CorC family transporter [Clostridia bacterium]|nr:HlyC/CorC family transporter [Clostridia bacterium]